MNNNNNSEKRKQQLDMPTSELVFCFTKGYQLLTYYLSSIKKSTQKIEKSELEFGN